MRYLLHLHRIFDLWCGVSMERGILMDDVLTSVVSYYFYLVSGAPVSTFP